MSFRVKFSIALTALGAILALLPLSGNRSFVVKPDKLLSELSDASSYLTVDQVARMIVTGDSSLKLIDVRSAEEYRKISIPGSINLPFSRFLETDPATLLNDKSGKIVFYSNGDVEANYALAIAKGLNIRNTYVMNGGLNEWFNTVINSSFSGARISARENALFETRTKAKNLFSELNNMPDSLKIKFLEIKQLSKKKLDGGCE
jgi:rhodanese-related sulfurtransferase